MGKGIQKLVQNAASESTNGCTLKLFRNAAEHRRLMGKSRSNRRLNRRNQHAFTVEELHRMFENHGKVPNFVESYVRGNHHRRAAPA